MVRAKPSHNDWTPSQGQAAAVQHMMTSAIVALWADPGAGKTSITLAAFAALLDAAAVQNMLVVAPLRVCQLVWRQEAKKWSQFRHLNVVLLHGAKKDQILADGMRLQPGLGKVDIFLVNYEGLDWLCDKYYGQTLPFDIVCADEITKLKAHDSKRAKKLRATTKKTPRKWGLTGTPVPNGYMDLFGQFLWLDGGAALGKYITHYRDLYFKADFTGWNYELQKGGAERIEARIAPYVFRLAYDAMPLVPDIRMLEFDKASLLKYREMKKDMLLELPEGTVTAANEAAVQQKLSQMANGAVYYIDAEGTRRWAHIHDVKLDALEDMLEELDGKQLLVAYEFGHDLERMLARFPTMKALAGNGDQVQQIEDDWNNGKIKLLAAHPASVGHGLNMQKGSANHLCWFSATWNLEHFDQLIRRLRRQGSQAAFVVNHILAVRGTIDELKIESLDGKDVTQARLLQVTREDLSEDTQDGRPRIGNPETARGSGEASGEASGVRNLQPGSDQRGAGVSPERRQSDLPVAHRQDQPRPEGADAGADGGNRTSEGGDRDSLSTHPDRAEPLPGGNPQRGDLDMAGFEPRLPTKNAAPAAGTPAPAARGVGVWPVKGQTVAGPAPAPVAQREAIRARVSAPVPQQVVLHEDQTEQDHEVRGAAPATGRGFFSKAVQTAIAPDDAAAVEEQAMEATATGQVQDAVVETPKPRAPRSRKTDTPAEIPETKGPAGDGPVFVGGGAPGATFGLTFSGLSPQAIKAALQAIADNL